MKTKSILILSFIVLITLPLVYVILKVAGIDAPSTNGFFYDYWPWALAFTILVGGSILINKLKKR